MANDRNSNNSPSIRELANENMRERIRKAKEAQREKATEAARKSEESAIVRAERESDSLPKKPAPQKSASQRPAAQKPAAQKPASQKSAPQRSSSPKNADPEVREKRRERDEAVQKRPVSRESGRSEREIERKRPAAKDAIKTERELKSREVKRRPEEARRRDARPQGARPQGNRNAQNRPSGNRHSDRNVSAKKEKKIPTFFVGLGIYTAILLVLSVLFLIYTDICLKKYEKSQSENYMAAFVSDFEGKVKSNSITASDFSFPSLDLKFVDTNSFLDDYIATLPSYSTFEAKKDATSYITEAPVYELYGDGNVIAKVTLKAVSQTKIFAILTIMDWEVDTVEPVCSITVTDYTILAPEGYTPVIAGNTVDTTYQTGNKEPMPGMETIAQYVTLPSLIEYKVSNVLLGSDIKILNPAGEEVPCTEKGNKVIASYSLPSATLTDERKESALKMVQTYEDFLTSDLSGANHGLATVQEFLIKGSDYWNLAKQWATGVDITFTSAHTFDNPKYSNVIVDNYCEYSENCFSLHIAFSKNMILTRTKEHQTNDFDSTVFFVYIDDTDDGVNNPHWCIADMIATTK